MDRNGKEYVSGRMLERDWKVAVKSLPGRSEIVICRADRCVMLSDEWLREDGELWVELTALMSALSLQLERNSEGVAVGFSEVPTEEEPKDDVIGVGALVPNLRLRRLDGEVFTLSDFRGKRVLINSWASW